MPAIVVTKVTTWMNTKAVKAAVKKASIEPLRKAALLVEREAKQSMKKGGRTTGVRGGKVKAPSEPGTPPHVQTGNLRASIKVAPTNRGTFLVGPTKQAWYGRLHEFGSKIHEQRAFMRPALLKIMKAFPKLFKGIL